jgi:hypothetical protein
MEIHKHFASPAVYASWMQENSRTHQHRHVCYSSVESDRPYVEQGIRLLEIGDDSIVARAQEMARQFTEQIPSLRKMWATDVAGFFPNVPAYLAGEPESMWRMDTEETDTTPLRIWVGVASTYNVTPEQMLNRGIALAAFAIALSERRPVFITPYQQVVCKNGESAYVSWDLQTSPMVYSQLCSLADVNITRYVGIRSCSLVNPGCNDTAYLTPIERVRRVLGAAEEDIVLGPANSFDPLLNNPTKWIKENLDKALGEEEKEAPPPKPVTYECPCCHKKFDSAQAFYDHLPKSPACNRWWDDYVKKHRKEAEDRAKAEAKIKQGGS